MTTELLRSVTYVSRRTAPLADAAFVQLGTEARRLNALDGITGLLVFNGERFCQTIEGAPAAISNLLDRLDRDSRHCDLKIITDEDVSERRFRSWDMQILSVPEEKEAALELARVRLDSQADFVARKKIYETVGATFG